MIFSRAQLIALGFLIIILVGSVLLMLPVATKTGESTSLLGAVFTATSATCVTGLIVYDTFTHWTLFGQIIILGMIQIGGLGFITFGVFGMSLLRKKIGLKDRELVHESLNSMHLAGGVKLVKNIVKGTFLFEGIGAALLSLRFIPQFGFLKGIYFSVFHSVSAFCNAGFDLFGIQEKYASLTNYYDDVLVNVVIVLLIIIGGIGFIVWEDISRNKLNFKKYMLHTKIVITVTLILLIGGTIFFYFSESNGLFSEMNFKEKILSSMFCAVSPRTAGFNTTDVAALTEGGKLMTVLLMFIGGSPGSTAGGIKTTTLAAIFFFIVSYIKKEKGYHAFNRGLENDIIKKASTVLFINLTLALFGSFVLILTNEVSFIDAAVETFSAISTVGMSAGITRDINVLSKIIIIILMYCGRVGSLSFALSFSERKKVPDIRYSKEEIIIG